MEQKSHPPRIKIISVGSMKATTTKFNDGRISEVKIDFFDFSGDPNYSEVRNEFYDNVDGVILMYDVTNKESFRALRSWLKEAGKYGVSHSNATIAVVGNKIDQYPRVVTENDGAKFAAENNAAYFETSAKTVATIDDLFDYLISSKFDDSKRC